MENYEEAVEWFHKALGLKRDDAFSTTMLNYVIEQLTEEEPPYPSKFIILVLLYLFVFLLMARFSESYLLVAAPLQTPY